MSRKQFFGWAAAGAILIAGTVLSLDLIAGPRVQAPVTLQATGDTGQDRPELYAAGGCDGGCCGQSSADRARVATEAVMAWYVSETGDRDVTVRLKDFGCHFEAEVLKGGEVIRKVSVQGTSVTDLG